MNAHELLKRLTELLAKPLDADEGFRFGDPEAEVRGVLVCWMCDPDAIEAAAKMGANVIVSHEALYFPYDIVDGGVLGSKQADFLSWPTNVQRVRMLAKHDMTVIRLHASVDRLVIFDTFAEQLGLGKPVVDEGPYLKLFEVAPISVTQLAANVKERLKLSGIRVAARDPNRIVRRVGSTWGGMGLFVNVSYPNLLLPFKPDVLIAGETDNYGFRFVTELGIDVIETSHEVSEHAGLEEFAKRAVKVAGVPMKYYANPIVWKMM